MVGLHKCNLNVNHRVDSVQCTRKWELWQFVKIFAFLLATISRVSKNWASGLFLFHFLLRIVKEKKRENLRRVPTAFILRFFRGINQQFYFHFFFADLVAVRVSTKGWPFLQPFQIKLERTVAISSWSSNHQTLIHIAIKGSLLIREREREKKGGHFV